MQEEQEKKEVSAWDTPEAKDVLHHYMSVVWDILEKREKKKFEEERKKRTGEVLKDIDDFLGKSG